LIRDFGVKADGTDSQELRTLYVNCYRLKHYPIATSNPTLDPCFKEEELTEIFMKEKRDRLFQPQRAWLSNLVYFALLRSLQIPLSKTIWITENQITFLRMDELVKKFIPEEEGIVEHNQRGATFANGSSISLLYKYLDEIEEYVSDPKTLVIMETKRGTFWQNRDFWTQNLDLPKKIGLLILLPGGTVPHTSISALAEGEITNTDPVVTFLKSLGETKH